MHAGGVAHDLCVLPELALERRHQNAASLGVKRPHPAQVSREVAFAHELEHDRLRNMRRTKIHCTPHGRKALDQVRGENEVAQS